MYQANNPDVGTQASIYMSYIEWETDQRAKHSKYGSKGPASDRSLIQAVFERAIALYVQVAGTAQTTLTELELSIESAEQKNVKSEKKGKGRKIRT